MEIIILLILMLILIFIIFLGLNVVRLREETKVIKGILSDLFDLQEEGLEPVSTGYPVENAPKSWDEKYEEELDAYYRKIRATSGLTELPNPGLSWGEPPAKNDKNSSGLTVIDK